MSGEGEVNEENILAYIDQYSKLETNRKKQQFIITKTDEFLSDEELYLFLSHDHSEYQNPWEWSQPDLLLKELNKRVNKNPSYWDVDKLLKIIIIFAKTKISGISIFTNQNTTLALLPFFEIFIQNKRFKWDLFPNSEHYEQSKGIIQQQANMACFIYHISVLCDKYSIKLPPQQIRFMSQGCWALIEYFIHTMSEQEKQQDFLNNANNAQTVLGSIFSHAQLDNSCYDLISFLNNIAEDSLGLVPQNKSTTSNEIATNIIDEITELTREEINGLRAQLEQSNKKDIFEKDLKNSPQKSEYFDTFTLKFLEISLSAQVVSSGKISPKQKTTATVISLVTSVTTNAWPLVSAISPFISLIIAEHDEYRQKIVLSMISKFIGIHAHVRSQDLATRLVIAYDNQLDKLTEKRAITDVKCIFKEVVRCMSEENRFPEHTELVKYVSNLKEEKRYISFFNTKENTDERSEPIQCTPLNRCIIL